MSKRILGVEDQVDNRQILRTLLTSPGYEMTEATTGEVLPTKDTHGRLAEAALAVMSEPE